MNWKDSFACGWGFSLDWKGDGTDTLYMGPLAWTFWLGLLLFAPLVFVFPFLGIYFGLVDGALIYELLHAKSLGDFLMMSLILITALSFLLIPIVFANQFVKVIKAYFYFNRQKGLRLLKARVTRSNYREWFRRGIKHAAFSATLAFEGHVQKVRLINEPFTIVNQFEEVRKGKSLRVLVNDQNRVVFLIPPTAIEV